MVRTKHAPPRLQTGSCFVADGLIVQELKGASAAQVLEVISCSIRDHRCAQGAARPPKLARSATAISIVLGVAMIKGGTFRPTDTFQGSVRTVFKPGLKEHPTPLINRQSAIGREREPGRHPHRRNLNRFLQKVRGLPRVSEAEGGISDEAKARGAADNR